MLKTDLNAKTHLIQHNFESNKAFDKNVQLKFIYYTKTENTLNENDFSVISNIKHIPPPLPYHENPNKY